MTLLFRTVVMIAFLVAGAVGGRMLARQQCTPCFNVITDGGPTGKYKSNSCFPGVCQNASAPSECYKETCSACKWNYKKRKGCQGGQNYVCPASGNCVDGQPRTPFVCENLCGC